MGFKLEDLHICYSDLLNKDTVMTWGLRQKHSTWTHLLVISSRCGGIWVPGHLWKLQVLFLCLWVTDDCDCGLRNIRLPGPLERSLTVCPGEQEMVAIVAGLRLWLCGSWQEDAGSLIRAETRRAALHVLGGTRGSDFMCKQSVSFQTQYTIPGFAVWKLGFWSNHLVFLSGHWGFILS